MAQSTKRLLNTEISQLKIQIDEEAATQQNYLDIIASLEHLKELKDTLLKMKEKTQELKMKVENKTISNL